MAIDMEKIKELVIKGKVAVKTHAIIRMMQRKIHSEDLMLSIIAGNIIESYDDDFPLPSCLILGKTKEGKTLHSVVAFHAADEMVWIITVYEPDASVWNDDFTKRREK
jgi:hypothetical protein